MQRRCYLEILGGKDGTPVARWPLDYKDGIVLSPDGKLLALGETVQNKAGQSEPTVHVYEVPSGREVARFVHDRVPWKNRVNAYLVNGLEFTPDGRYLITSANNKVKIWQVEHQG
jgi:WD40 repeat protein